MIARRLIFCSRVAAFAALARGFAPTVGQGAWLAAAIALPFLCWSATFCHELGHVFAAGYAGGRITMLAVRPVCLRFSPLHLEWFWKIRRAGWSTTGRTEYYFDRRHGQRWGLVSAAGAIADIVLVLISVTIVFLAGNDLATGLACTPGISSAASAVATLLPYPGSDGAELAKLRRVSARRAGSLAASGTLP